MKLKAYTKYKSSGVDWLGDSPEKWDIKRLKCLISTNDNALPETTNPDYEMLYVDISSIDPVRGIVNKEPFIFENAPSRARRIVKDGDTIVSTVRTYLRAIAPIDNPEGNLIVSTGFAVLRPRKILPRYLSYVMRSPYVIETIVSKSVGVSYPAINASEIGLIKILVPMTDEQNAIIKFLDRETGRIDELIEKNEQLIERLKEKRTAMISRAVTKGLDLNVRLKSSGVEWLGDVPEHWKIDKYSHHFVSSMGQTILKEDLIDDGVIPVYSATESGAIFGYINSPVVKLSAGDVVIPARGVSIGYPVLIDRDATCTQTTIYSKQYSGEIVSKYLFLYFVGLRSHLFPYDRTAIPQITVEQVSSNKILIPPRDEQMAIAVYLDSETGKIDALVERVQTAIQKLNEFRTALISAAVTGKVDVRGVV